MLTTPTAMPPTHRVLGLDMPSSTQQMWVTSPPTLTTQALLRPALKVAHTLSWWRKAVENSILSRSRFISSLRAVRSIRSGMSRITW